MDSFENKVVVESFSKWYGSKKHQWKACSNMNFEAEKGLVTGILGLNGAGKTTFLKALCGMHYASSGRISVCGHTDCTAIRSITGYVPETPELDRTLSVKELLHQEALLHDMPCDKVDDAVKKTVRLFELETVLAKKTVTLSKGFKQRTSLAKAFVFSPKVLVLDEFSEGLDPAQTVSVRQAIKNISKSCITILSTHHIEEALLVCDYLYIVHKGSVVAKGTAGEIIDATGKKSMEEAFLWLTKD